MMLKVYEREPVSARGLQHLHFPCRWPNVVDINLDFNDERLSL